MGSDKMKMFATTDNDKAVLLSTSRFLLRLDIRFGGVIKKDD